jgi:hypothetical protein
VGDLGVLYTRRFLGLLGCLLLAGCSSDATEPEQAPTGEPPGDASPEALAVARLLGAGGGAAPSYFTVYDPSDDTTSRPLYPTALAWNPAQQDELWITLREPPQPAACTKATLGGCGWLPGRVAIVHGVGAAPAEPFQVETTEDANAWHFMRRPTSIAFGDDGTFATCAEARTSNYDDEAVPFNGPVLWSADPAIFGAEPPENSPTGSTHIDMLHESPFCMGIAHERDNVYWTLNGDAGSLDRYDFHQPHYPGGDNHTDGELERYVSGELERVDDFPSHLAFDRASGLLYAADTGHQRIVALDTTSGTPGEDVIEYDNIEIHRKMNGANLAVVVASGRLQMPSGLTLHEGVLFVTDALTSHIVAYDLEGHTLASLDTGLPIGALAGIAIGPDLRAYFADRSSGRVLRIDPAESR